MNPKKLHIVSFDVPFPPNYGGVIDVFYKIKELCLLGIEIHLHCFEYGRKKQDELEQYCTSITYYKRQPYIKSLFSTLPFVVKSRANSALIKNLKKIEAPILFEGLHTSFPIYKTEFSQAVYVRAHNIEHDYYKGLAASERSILKRLFYKQEAFKLKKYQKVLEKTTGIFTISPFEQQYFTKIFGKKASYIPAFHLAEKSSLQAAKGKTILYHGDLRISDNIKAVLFLINNFKDSKYKFVIASSFENLIVRHALKGKENMSFILIDKPLTLKELFEEAHIHVLVSFQKTGIKLKLLNSLYRGRFIIANTPMIAATGLESLCELANTKNEFLNKAELLFKQDFTKEESVKRMEKLAAFNPSNSAKKIMAIIFK